MPVLPLQNISDFLFDVTQQDYTPISAGNYLLADGSTQLTNTWNAGNYLIKSQNSTMMINAAAQATGGNGTSGNPWTSPTGTGGIQEAFNLLTTPYGVVYVQAGYYLISNTLNFTDNSGTNLNPNGNSFPVRGVTILGDGMANTFLIDNTTRAATKSIIMDCAGEGGMTLKNFSIIGTAGKGTVGIYLARSTVGSSAHSQQTLVENVYIDIPADAAANNGNGTVGFYIAAAESNQFVNDWSFANVPVYMTGTTNSYGVTSAFVPAPALNYVTTNLFRGGYYMSRGTIATSAAFVMEDHLDNTTFIGVVPSKSAAVGSGGPYAFRIRGTNLINGLFWSSIQVEGFDGFLDTSALLYGANLNCSIAQNTRALVWLQGASAGLAHTTINLSPGSVNPPSQPLLTDDGSVTNFGVKGCHIHLYYGQYVLATKTAGSANQFLSDQSSPSITWSGTQDASAIIQSATSGTVQIAGRLGKVSVGTSSPPANGMLVVSKNATTYTNDDSEAIAQFVGADSTSTKLNLDAFGAGTPSCYTRYANGTSGTKTSTPNSTNIGLFGARGYETNAYFDSGYVLWSSTEAWAAGAHGAQCAIYATPTGSGSAISHIVFKDSYVQVPYRIATGTSGLVPLYPLHVASTVGTTGAVDTAGFIQDIATAADAAQTRRGLTGSVNYTAGAGAISVANAIQGSLTVAAGGTATTGYPFTTSVTGSGTVTTLAHYSTVDPTTPTITTQYGYYCPSLVKATTNYAFYAAGTTKSYFGGNVGINKTAPTSLLHVEGTATYSGTGMVNFTYTVNPSAAFESAVVCRSKATTATAFGTYCLSAISEATHTSGTLGGVTPVYAIARTSGAGGTTTNCFGVYSTTDIGAGTTATNAACFYAANNLGAGVPQFQYGLYIEPLTTAGFANYGIFSRMASPYYTLWSGTTGLIYHAGQTSLGIDGSTYTDGWLSIAERQPQLLYLRNTTAGGDSGGGQLIIGSNGTAGSNYTKSGDWISLIGSRGVISTGWEGSSVAALIAAATENHTTTNKGTRYAIETTQTTTTTRAEKLGVEHDGVITQTLRGLATKLSGTLFSQTATSTTTANSLTTMLGTGVGTLTLPANFLMAGRGIRVTVGGYVSTADGGAGTKTITFSIGGVTVATATSGATFTNVLNAGWEASAWFTLYTTGAPGTGWGGAKWGSQIASAAPTAVVATVTSAAAITTTGTLAIDFKYNNGNATGVLTTTYAHVEVIGAV